MAQGKLNVEKAREFYSWGETAVLAVAFVVIALTFIFRTASVDGPSMFPTLHDKEQLIISDFLFHPSDGDIIVFDSISEDKALVKRVIATEGQTVVVDGNTNQVIVDGKPLDESYIAEPTQEMGNQTYPLTVPKGEIFVMGDNRNDSFDSRFMEIGCIDTRYVIGKVLFRFFPINRLGGVS